MVKNAKGAKGGKSAKGAKPSKPAKAAKPAPKPAAKPAPKAKPAAPKPTYAPPPVRKAEDPAPARPSPKPAPAPKPAEAPKPAPAPAPAAPPAPTPKVDPTPRGLEALPRPKWTPPVMGKAAQAAEAAKTTAAPVTPAPDFVKKASFADRKAALEALAEKEGLPAIGAPPAPPAAPAPSFVKETGAAERKAAMEKVVEEQGVTSALSKAPWKRSAAPAPAPVTPPTPAAPAPKEAPRATMTKAPISETTGRSPPSVVILDSNALMMQFQFHIDIEKEVNRLLGGNYQMVVPQIVVDELARITKEGAQKEATEARMAIELAKTFQIVESPGDGDTGILRAAERINAIVVTNDKKLRAQLRAKGIPNIYMRSRAFLTIEGHIPGL